MAVPWLEVCAGLLPSPVRRVLSYSLCQSDSTLLSDRYWIAYGLPLDCYPTAMPSLIGYSKVWPNSPPLDYTHFTSFQSHSTTIRPPFGPYTQSPWSGLRVRSGHWPRAGPQWVTPVGRATLSQRTYSLLGMTVC